MFAAGIDPSSTKSGVCLFRDGKLVRWGVVKPDGRTSGTDKCRSMAERVSATLSAWKVPKCNRASTIYIEIPGRQARTGPARGGAGLITLGMAIMCVIRDIQWLGWENVVEVEVGSWGRMGAKRFLRKEEKQQIVREAFPSYDPKKDKGMDASDAIAMTAYIQGLVKAKI